MLIVVAFCLCGGEMAEPTVTEMLTNVRVAINNALLAGGSIQWQFNGRLVQHDYRQLLEIEKRLMERQLSEQPSASSVALVNFEQRPS
jgi:hypothetical protein